jgi:hypothetical protein
MMVVAVERIWLDVPFGDKDAAKAAGARWDPAARRWFAPRPGMPALARWSPLPEILPGEDRAYGTGLFVDLIPQTSWFTNVRAAVHRADWDRLRLMVYRRAGFRCEACSAAEDWARGVRLEAHERFAYDITTGVQHLVRLICLCHWCHAATHMGMAGVRGVQDEAITHLMTVTGMSEAQAEEHIDEAFTRWERRSEIPWRVDLSLITSARIRLSQPTPAVPRLPGTEGRGTDGADETRPDLDILVVTTVAMVAPDGQQSVPGPATRALAATYERYAGELAAIEAIRGRQRSA